MAIRRNVIIIASAISGMAGALLTFQVASIGPGTWDRITWTFYIWVMVIIGGSGNNFGVATGALWFSFLSSGITQVQNALPSDLPIDVDARLADDPAKTLRQRLEVTKQEFCWQCHQRMNPLGLPFEMYDHFGRHRADAHVRFAYTIELGKLREGVRRLADWLPSLGLG